MKKIGTSAFPLGPSVITDICEKTKTRHFFWTPSPKTNMCVSYGTDIFWRWDPYTYVCIHYNGLYQYWFQEHVHRIHVPPMSKIINCDSVGVHCGSRRCFETWRKCCGSKLDESAAHRNLTKFRVELRLTKVLCIKARRKRGTFCDSRALMYFQETNLANPPPPPLPQITRLRFFANIVNYGQPLALILYTIGFWKMSLVPNTYLSVMYMRCMIFICHDPNAQRMYKMYEILSHVKTNCEYGGSLVQWQLCWYWSDIGPLN